MTTSTPAAPTASAPVEKYESSSRISEHNAELQRATEARRLPETCELDDSVERRESVLNARLAAFEAAARQFASAEFIQRDRMRREDEARRNKLTAALEEREAALAKKLEDIQKREANLTEIFASFESRESELTRRFAELQDREDKFQKTTGAQGKSLDEKLAFLREQESRLTEIANGGCAEVAGSCGARTTSPRSLR